MSSFLARRATAAPQLARAFSSTSARPVARISLVGTLGNTPEIQTTNSGRELLKYSVATNQVVRGEQKTSWFRVTNFQLDGARREFFQSLPKGTLVYVEGEASMDKFTDNEGKQRTTLSIIQRNLEVLRRPAPKSDMENDDE